jgi:hypothetical protein
MHHCTTPKRFEGKTGIAESGRRQGLERKGGRLYQIDSTSVIEVQSVASPTAGRLRKRPISWIDFWSPTPLNITLDCMDYFLSFAALSIAFDLYGN